MKRDSVGEASASADMVARERKQWPVEERRGREEWENSLSRQSPILFRGAPAVCHVKRVTLND